MGWLKIIGFIGSPHEFFNEFPSSSWVARRWPVPPRKLGCCSTSQRKAVPKTVYSTSWRQWHPEIWQEYASHHIPSVSMIKMIKQIFEVPRETPLTNTNQHISPADGGWVSLRHPSGGRLRCNGRCTLGDAEGDQLFRLVPSEVLRESWSSLARVRSQWLVDSCRLKSRDI